MNCLLVVDVQNDFLPGGALPVSNGDAIFEVVNRLIRHFPLVVATQDWHPEGHSSFASSHEGRQPFDVIEIGGHSQKLWPDHCVQGSAGAELSARLETKPIATVFRKAMDPAVDSYSAFFDNHRAHQTGLAGYLRGLGIRHIFIAGLTADFCVAFTASDGVQEGFQVTVVEDATLPIDAAAYLEIREELAKKGVTFSPSDHVLTNLRRAA